MGVCSQSGAGLDLLRCSMNVYGASKEEEGKACMARERDKMKVVSDQHGCPTRAANHAGALHAVNGSGLDGPRPQVPLRQRW